MNKFVNNHLNIKYVVNFFKCCCILNIICCKTKIVGNSEGSSKKEEIEDEEEEEEETETSSESSETDSDEDSEDAKPKTPASKGMEKTDIGPLLARSAQARDNGSGSNSSSRRTSQDESYTRSR